MHLSKCPGSSEDLRTCHTCQSTYLIKSQTEFKWINLKRKLNLITSRSYNLFWINLILPARINFNFLGQGWVRTNRVHEQLATTAWGPESSQGVATPPGDISLQPAVGGAEVVGHRQPITSDRPGDPRSIPMTHANWIWTEQVGRLWTTGEASQGILVYPHDPTLSKCCGGQPKDKLQNSY